MVIGKFTQQGEGYAGSIGFAIPYVVFSPVPAKRGDSKPDFVVLGAPPNNTTWQRGDPRCIPCCRRCGNHRAIRPGTPTMVCHPRPSIRRAWP
jgi:hypothetical protein